MGQILSLAILLAALAFPAPGHAAVDGTIGVVRNSTGSSTITRGADVLPASAGARLQAGDTLGTGSDGSIGIILRDNSRLSLGPGSRLVIREFLFSPSDGELGMLVRIIRGSMAYISGLIGKLAPERIRFETPTATIGVRGTYFAVKVVEAVSDR